MPLAHSVLAFPLPNLAATAGFARRLAGLLRTGDAVLLEGPLGAGKTAFARALLRAMTSDAGLEVPSPSYTLVQAYSTPIGPVHHFDLWRIERPESLIELGWDEAREGIVLVEWPDRLGPLWPTAALRIAFAFAGDGRTAELCGWPDRLERLT